MLILHDAGNGATNMKTDKTVLGSGIVQQGILSVKEEDPERWLAYLDERRINPKAATRRIDQLRASKAAALLGRKSDL